MKYRTIVADPPWPFRWTGGASTRVNGRGERHINHQAGTGLDYPTMSVNEILALTVPAAEDANLFLWTTEAFLMDGTARNVALTWGFLRPRLLIWRKSGFGLGTFPRPQHEACLVAVRGGETWQRRNIGSVQAWKLVYESGARKHSAKPDGFYDLVQSVSPGPYLELFARRQRLGWDTWGDEALQHVELA